MTDLDTALRDLRAIALQRGWSRIEVTVRADGFVNLLAFDSSGYAIDDIDADLDLDSAPDLPSRAVEEWSER